MLEPLWNYLRGYVMINISGFSAERFLSLAATRGILLWDVIPYKNGFIAKVKLRDFKKLRPCGQKTGCRYRIYHKKGFPFLCFRYRKRKVLEIGLILFVISLYFFSSFLWSVEIHGTKRLSGEEILLYCSELGLKPGGWKRNINTTEITDNMVAHFQEIGWAAITIEGTKAVVEVSETIPQPKLIDRQTPSNITATKEGIIDQVSVITGTALVKPGDVVQPGDVLVSGELILRDGTEEIGRDMARAQAELKARTQYKVEESVIFQQKQRLPTGKTVNEFTLHVGNWKKSFCFEKKDARFEQKSTKTYTFSFGDYVFPFMLQKNIYEEILYDKKTVTEDEAKKQLEEMLEEKMEQLQQEEIEIDTVTKNFIRSESGLKLQADITAIEEIGKEGPMTVKEEMIDGESNSNG